MTPLRWLLRPAGGGLQTFSSGRKEQEALAQALYRVKTVGEVHDAWLSSLAQVANAQVAVLGIPSDVGAGLVRGAAYGPQELRATWLRADGQGSTGRKGVVDVGDVRVIPQLLHDDMLSDAQKADSRAALYADVPLDVAATLPVSPLSVAESALDEIFRLNPNCKLLMLGGDHSVAWPVVAALGKHMKQPWAILHFDAHTDLLPTRLGVRYCFATWAFAAIGVLGQPGRMVQVGIRASGHDRGHWEQNLGVKQFCASEVLAQPVQPTVNQIVAHLHAQGVRHVYISNDIDGTDMSFAPATGTPEPGGLPPEVVIAVIEAVGRHFSVIGADLVEVAPPVGDRAGAAATCEVGVSYLLASVAAML